MPARCSTRCTGSGRHHRRRADVVYESSARPPRRPSEAVAERRRSRHAARAWPWVDVATGSLGQGLPIAVGMALSGKYVDKLPFNVWVLLGDSEVAEGSIWESPSTKPSLQAKQRDCHSGHEPTGPAGTDGTRLGCTRLCRPRPAFGGMHRESTATTSPLSVQPIRKRAPGRETHMRRREDRERLGRLARGKQGRMAWQGPQSGPGERGHQGTGRRAPHHVHVAKPAQVQAATPPVAQPLRLPVYEVGTEEATRKAFGMRSWRSAPVDRT